MYTEHATPSNKHILYNLGYCLTFNIRADFHGALHIGH